TSASLETVAASGGTYGCPSRRFERRVTISPFTVSTSSSKAEYQPTKLTRVNVNRQACSTRRDHRGLPDTHPGRVSLIGWAGTVTHPLDANSGRWQQGAETAASS